MFPFSLLFIIQYLLIFSLPAVAIKNSGRHSADSQYRHNVILAVAALSFVSPYDTYFINQPVLIVR